MKQFNFTEARKNFAAVLELAKKEGVICISKRDGSSFYITPAQSKKSPLDVQGVDFGLADTDIVSIVKEGRNRSYGI